MVKPLAIDSIDQSRPMTFQVRKGAGDHYALILARRIAVARHRAPNIESPERIYKTNV
jgi:hypothetical protein